MRQPLFMKMGFDMKKHFFIFILTVLMLASACAFAAPELSNVMADDVKLISGQNDWYFDFETTEGGTLAMRLYSGDTGEFVCEVGTAQVEEGTGRISWDGMLTDGSAVPEGNYILMIQLRNYWGEESEQQLICLLYTSGCTMEELLAQFHKHSDHVRVEELHNGEFDWLIEFEDGEPDEYRYCIADEGGHLTYHRFTREDYEAF